MLKQSNVEKKEDSKKVFRLNGAIALGLALVVTLLNPHSAQAEVGAASVVKSIIDGETLELANGDEVKLIGVTTRDQSGQMTEDDSFGRGEYLAKKFMQAAILGKKVILSHDPAFKRTSHRDSKGRLLAYVRYSVHFQNRNSSGLSYSATAVQKVLNAEIINQGYGFAEQRKNYREKELYVKLQDEAREKKKGVWRPQTQFYEKMIERGKGARSGSVSKYVNKATRRMSLESAEKTFSELIQLVPGDYRAYYERSWVGVDSLNHKVGKQRLSDIEKAIELSASNPKCYAQKHFILRLLGRHAEAVLAYEEAVELASRYGMSASVTYFTDQERESGRLQDPYGGKEMVGLAADAYRASLNADHFLIFMSRYKKIRSSGGQAVEDLYNQMMKSDVFKAFHDAYAEIINNSKPHELLYRTTWGLQGWDDPEEVLTKMEKAVV